MDNIAEGCGSGGNKEVVNFLSIAKGTNDETGSQAYRAFDFKHITQEQFSEALERTNQISKKTASLIKRLKGSPLKGPKFPTPNVKP